MDRRLKYRGYAAWIFSWAALVSLSRVFVSMHYFGDILCGAIAGSIIGLAIAFAARYVCGKWLPLQNPTVKVTADSSLRSE